MKPLFVLLISFGFAILVIKIFTHHNDFALAARSWRVSPAAGINWKL